MKMFSDNLNQLTIKTTFRINLLYSYLILIEEGFFFFIFGFWVNLVFNFGFLSCVLFCCFAWLVFILLEVCCLFHFCLW